jgi:hypothetical protein
LKSTVNAAAEAAPGLAAKSSLDQRSSGRRRISRGDPVQRHIRSEVERIARMGIATCLPAAGLGPALVTSSFARSTCTTQESQLI